MKTVESMGRRNRGRKRRKRPRLPRADLEAVYDALAKESDRGAVLIGAQMLQDRLENVLRSLFKRMADIPWSISSPEKLDNLLFELVSSEGRNAPLARSWPRIALCRALGLLGEKDCDAIEGIQRIRNHFFAHHTGHVSLSNPIVVEVLNEVFDNFDDYQSLKTFESEEWHWKKHNRKFSEARTRFMAMASVLHVIIGEAYQEMYARFIPPRPEGLGEKIPPPY
jgi:hypothetical protein